MSKMRLVILGLAILAAGAAMFMARNFVSAPKQTADKIVQAPKIETVGILVAAKDLRLGDRLGEGAVSWVEMPKNLIQEAMITKDEMPDALEKYKDARARSTLFNGEPIIDRKLVLSGDKGFLAAILPKGMRAISVAISERSSAGGFILPDDRVDVILTKKTSVDGGQLVTSETVLQSVRILAINQQFQRDPENDTIAVAEGKTATLELTAIQAEVLAKVESLGELSLSLRSIAESDGKSIEKEKPILAEKYTGTSKNSQNETLFVRYGRETYATNR
jgi:pilus assembly protein CpaB